MSSNALFIAWYSALILAICLIGLGVVYRRHLKAREILKNRINQAEQELMVDLSKIDMIELNKTSAGKELLRQISEVQAKPIQESAPKNINSHLGFAFFTLATCITSIIVVANVFSELQNSSGELTLENLFTIILAILFFGISVYVLKATKFYFAWENTGSLNRLLAYTTVLTGFVVIFPIAILLVITMTLLRHMTMENRA